MDSSNIVKSSQDIVLFGSKKDLKIAIQQALNNHRDIWNKDLGQIVGIPIEDLGRAKHQDRKLIVIWKSVPKPPWRNKDGTRAKTFEYTIPEALPELTWESIKSQAIQFEWGPWRLTAHLANLRQMAVYGSSKSECENLLNHLLKLTTTRVVAATCAEDIVKDQKFYKHPTHAYPAYATIVTMPTDFQAKPLGGEKAYHTNRRRINLWTPKPSREDEGII